MSLTRHFLTSSDPVIVDGFFARGRRGAHHMSATIIGNIPSEQRDIEIHPEFIGAELGDLVGAWVRFPVVRNECCGPVEIVKPTPFPTAVVKGIPMIQVSCKVVGKPDGHWLLENGQIGDIIDNSNVFSRYRVTAVMGRTYDLWIVKWCHVLRSGERVWWIMAAFQGQDFSSAQLSSSVEKTIRQQTTRPASAVPEPIPVRDINVPSSTTRPGVDLFGGRATQMVKQPCRFGRPTASAASSQLSNGLTSTPYTTRQVNQSPDLIPPMERGVVRSLASAAAVNQSKVTSLDSDRQMSMLLLRAMCNREIRRAIEKADKVLYEEIIDRLV